MTQGPVLVDIVGALEADGLVLEHDRVEHDEDLGRVRRPHSERRVRRKVHKARVELIWVLNAGNSEPLLVDFSELFDAIV